MKMMLVLDVHSGELISNKELHREVMDMGGYWEASNGSYHTIDNSVMEEWMDYSLDEGDEGYNQCMYPMAKEYFTRVMKEHNVTECLLLYWW